MENPETAGFRAFRGSRMPDFNDEKSKLNIADYSKFLESNFDLLTTGDLHNDLEFLKKKRAQKGWSGTQPSDSPFFPKEDQSIFGPPEGLDKKVFIDQDRLNEGPDWIPPEWVSPKVQCPINKIILRPGRMVMVYVRAPGVFPGWYSHTLKEERAFAAENMVSDSKLGLLEEEALQCLREHRWITFHTDKMDYPFVSFSFFAGPLKFPLADDNDDNIDFSYPFLGDQGVRSTDDPAGHFLFPGVYSLEKFPAYRELPIEFIEQRDGFAGEIQ